MNEKPRIENRVSGLGRAVIFGGIAILYSNLLSNNLLGNSLKTIMDAGCAIVATDGIGDLVTGQNHYLSSRLIKHLNERRNLKYLI
ncbi:MAG: hypothetical protein Q7S06_00345 [Nanoarchaeota archaeon]|nr:hypothetical protein [Nanoarchaeota archaeon]